MKKNLQILMVVLAACSASFLPAQTNFKFEQTSYVGALSGDPAKDWTAGWANWDPKTTTYAAPTDTVALNGMVSTLPKPGEKLITNTVTLDASKVYLLKGLIVVKSGGKLVIPAGTVVRALANLSSSPANYASIVVERGGQIEITGTAAQPVVFTSAKAAGSRERGDWGGIVICGNAVNNQQASNPQIEGFNNVAFDNTLAFHGGTNNSDNSGILRYLRLEFGGLAFEVNKEINGLTFGSVGSATVVDNIQVSFSNDDSFEWFGGTVNSKHLIAFKGTDDDFDTDFGYSGYNQFGIAIRDLDYFDATYAATSGASTSEGFESDNEASGTANVKPITSAIFSNYTMVGPIPVGSNYSALSTIQRAAFRRGARIRRNSALRITNSIFMGYRNFLMIDGDSTIRNTNYPAALALVNPKTPVDQKTHQTFFTNNLIVNTAAAQAPADSTSNSLLEVARARGSAAKLAALDAWVKASGNLANNINPVPFTAGTLLVNPLSASTTPDFKPVDGSPALTGANFFDNPILAPLTQATPSTQSTFKMEQTSYVGALSADPAKDWTTGWANWNPKTTAYPVPTDTVTLNGMVSSLPKPGEKLITSTVTLDATQIYLLKGLIVVKSGAKLVIPAGTVIRALANLSSSPANYASIVVERGGQIEILGSSAQPVVFTSAKAAGSRERGDWGGIVICGNAVNNQQASNPQIEGFNNIAFDNTLAFHGGTNNSDNSGILRYLRLEFGGLAFEVNKEINGLTFGSVGSATEVNNIQVSFSNDDSFEWFGGTVNSKNLIAFKGTDDDFDTDFGYSGLNQFGIAIRDLDYFDATYAATSGASTSEGFESDNEASGTANVKPITSALFSNYTMVGPIAVGSTYTALSTVQRAAFRRGARIRRNSALRITNSIFMGYRNFLMIDGDSTIRNTNFPAALALVNPKTPVDQKTHQTFFTNNLIVNTAAAQAPADSTSNSLLEVARARGSAAKLAALNDWARQTGPLANNINPVAFTTGTVLINPLASSTTPDFKPVTGSPALSGANFSDNPILSALVTSLREINRALTAAHPVYPNPVSADSELYFGRQVPAYGIFDLNGRLLRHGIKADRASLNGLDAGIYIIKFNDNAQRFIVK